MSEHPKSRYAPLEVPEFKSTIPAHLLGKLTDSERFMVETMSKLENQSDFLVKAAMQGNRENLDIDARMAVLETWKQKVGNVEECQDKINKLWDWHQMLSGKWAVIWAFGLILVPIVLKLLIDLVVKKGP